MARGRSPKTGNVPEIAARLRGVPRLVVDGEETPLERKTAGLLAYLAVRGPSTRAAVAALLWPASVPEARRNNLRQALFKLKKAAGRDLVVGADALSLAEGLSCDLRDRPTDDPLLGACEYEDCPEFLEWLTRERERLDQERSAALAAEAERLESAGDLDAALEAALRLLRVAPLEEAHHRRAMRLHYLRADRAAAMAAFEHCARVLRDELDTEPDAETRALAASIADESAPKRAARAEAVPVTLLRTPRLVGRDPELRAMETSWAEARAFLLLGEAGLGKSRLIHEFAQGRSSVVTSSARPGDPGIPYASLARLLRALVERRSEVVEPGMRRVLAWLLPELGERTDREMRPGALQAALSDLLERAAAQGVEGLVLDDLHFADPASLEMVNLLAAESTVRWGFAQRPAEGAPQARALRSGLSEAWRLDAIVLKALDERQMLEFVESLRLPGISAAELAPRLLKLTGGNPLFALEALKGALHSRSDAADGRPLALPHPESVGAVIERRLVQLSPRALALARAAAIAGVDFDAQVAADVLGESPIALADAWRELEDAQVLSGAAFAHDLIYEATLRGIPGPIARHAHGVIAARLEQRQGVPERIAEHWLGAGEPARAMPFLKAAAVRGEAAGRYREARAWLERAIELAERAGDGREALELRFLLIELLKEAGQAREILAVVERAHADATTTDDRFRLARVETQAMTVCGDSKASKAIARRFLEDEDLCAEADPLRVAELRFMLASTHITDFEGAQALALLAPMEPIFRNHPDLQFRGWFYQDLIRALYTTDRVAEAEALIGPTLEIARRVGRKRMICGVMLFAANAAAAAGRINEPFEHVHEAQLLSAESDDSMLGRVFGILVTDFLLRQGRYREALASIAAAEASSALMTPVWFGRMHEVHALALAHLGEAHAARRQLEAADAFVSESDLRRMRLVHRLETLQLIGQPIAEALGEYEGLVDDLAPSSVRWRGRFFAAAAGPAPDDFESIAASARSSGLMGHAIGAHVAAATSASRAGDADRASANVRAALELLRRFTLSAAYRPALWLRCHEAVRELDPALALEALREGAGWVRTVARYHVPEERRQSFLRANRVNRALLEAERAAGMSR